MINYGGGGVDKRSNSQHPPALFGGAALWGYEDSKKKEGRSPQSTNNVSDWPFLWVCSGTYCTYVVTSLFFTLLLSSFWISRGHRCRPFSPPGSCLQFLSRTEFSNPTARRFFIECCELTLSRFPQVNLCTRTSPHEFIRVCTRGARTRETDLYQARG